MNSFPKISIIVPVYNAERFIAQCINSVLMLNERDWELILVDDGSNDQSVDICSRFATQDSRIKICSQRNAGASAARNVGLDYAKGEWISFVDADDWVDENFFDCLSATFEYDIVYFGFKTLKNSQVINNVICNKSYSATGNIDSTLVDLLLSKELFYGFTWNKFYRRSIIEQNRLRFNEELTIKEDEEFIIRYCRFINSLYISNTTAYNYRILSDSMSHQGLKFKNMTALASAIETDLVDYPWKKFELEMRRRVYHYYKCGVTESLKTNLYNANLNIWLDYYDRNSQCLKSLDEFRFYINLPDGIRKKILTRRVFQFIHDNPTPVVAVKRLLQPFKVIVSNMVFRFRKPPTVLKGHNLWLGVNIRVMGHGSFRISDNVIINDNSSFCFNPINTCCPEIVIGKGVHLGKYNDFGCSERIEIDDYVITAPYVHVTDRNHCYEDIGTPVMLQPTCVKGAVKIGRGSWLGFGVQVMSGVTIGRQCVIAAGSIVTKDIPDYSVAGGNPAKVIKRFNIFTGLWERV